VWKNQVTHRIENGTAPKQVVKTPAFGGLSSEKKQLSSKISNFEHRNSPELSISNQTILNTSPKQISKKGETIISMVRRW
jgi:hypothetical protein